MEYVFGTGEGTETLKTKGSAHSGLTGFHQLERIYPDQTITDHFRIVKKIDSMQDDEGNCYDLYEIDNHYRFTDKFSPMKDELVGGIADAQDATCELSEEVDARITDIENALCELTEEV